MSSPGSEHTDLHGPIPIVPDAALDAPLTNAGVTPPTAPAKCIGCGYLLLGIDPTGPCPECGKPVAQSLAAGILVDRTNPNATLAMDKACVTCGYNLRGAIISGNCPECGTPVEHSLRGHLLQFASREWITTIRKGLSLVLNGILLTILLIFVSIALGAVGAAMGFSGVQLLTSGFGLCVSLMIAWGYWKLTEPDPGVGETESVQTARKTIRVVVAVQACLALVSFLLQAVQFAIVTVSQLIVILTGLLTLVGVVAWVVQFICVMNYVAWLGSRVPDAWIARRAKRYRWLLPVIAVAGAIALFLGPLIALVMYWNILDRLRKHGKAIEKTGVPAQLKGMSALG